MRYRLLIPLLSILIISAVSGPVCLAQATVPIAGVHGTGAIAVGTNAGLFDINWQLDESLQTRTSEGN